MLVLWLLLGMGKDPDMCRQTMHMVFLGKKTVESKIVECSECYAREKEGKHQSEQGSYYYTCEKVSK